MVKVSIDKATTMGIIALLLIFVAPIIQIIWSNRRLNNKTQMPIGGIVVLMAAMGVGLSLGASYLSYSSMPPANHYWSCLGGGAAFMMLGGIIALIGVPIIGIVYMIIYYFKIGHLSGDQEAVAKVNEVLKKHYK